MSYVIEKRSRSMVAAESMARNIINGTYRPGAALLEEELAEALKISRIPTREALLRLEGQGYLYHTPYCGCYLKPLNEEDVAHIIAAMGLQLSALHGRKVAVNVSRPAASATAWDNYRAEQEVYETIFQSDEIARTIILFLHRQLWRYGRVIMDLRQKNEAPITSRILDAIESGAKSRELEGVLKEIEQAIVTQLGRKAYSEEIGGSKRFAVGQLRKV